MQGFVIACNLFLDYHILQVNNLKHLFALISEICFVLFFAL